MLFWLSVSLILRCRLYFPVWNNKVCAVVTSNLFWETSLAYTKEASAWIQVSVERWFANFKWIALVGLQVNSTLYPFAFLEQLIPTTRTHSHLVRKWTLKHLPKLAKWLRCVMSTYLYGAFDCMFFSCHVRV